MAHNFKWINDSSPAQPPKPTSPLQPPRQISAPLSLNSSIRSQGVYRNTPSGNQYFYICSGDVTKENVDAIISPTDPRMSLGGGLSKYLASTGGPAITEEAQKIMRQKQALAPGDAVVTPGGKINVKAIVYVCGPSPDLRGSQFETVLVSCINNALTIASMRDVRSVSVPAIGAGANRGDKDLITRTLADACMKWFDANQNSSLKHIAFIDTSEEILQCYARYMSSRIQ